jgi:hypothetical protein
MWQFSEMSELSPHSGKERKLDFRAVRSVEDPERTPGLDECRAACQSQRAADLSIKGGDQEPL